jgi:hypothetical protein
MYINSYTGCDRDGQNIQFTLKARGRTQGDVCKIGRKDTVPETPAAENAM